MLEDIFRLKENEQFINCFDEFENVCLRKGHYCKISLPNNEGNTIPSDYLIEHIEERQSKIIITVTDDSNEARKISFSKVEIKKEENESQIRFFRKIVSGVNDASVG